MLNKLNLGCRYDLKEDHINIDILPFENIKKLALRYANKNIKGYAKNYNFIQHDLNSFPYPFSDNIFIEIYAHHVLEHLENIEKAMEELHRISKANCKIIIETPHYSDTAASTIIEHKHTFGVRTFDIYNRVFYPEYSNRFIVERTKLIWKQQGFLTKIIDKIINKNRLMQLRCERYLANYIGGFERIEYILRVVKK